MAQKRFTILVQFVTAIIAVVSLATGCVSIPDNTNTQPTMTTQPFQIPASYKTYADESNLFTVSYPPDLEPVENLDSVLAQVKDEINAIKSDLPLERASLLFMAGVRIQGGYLPSLNIVVEPSPLGVSNVDQAIQAELQGLKQIDPNYQEISRIKTVINGKESIILEYRAKWPTVDMLMHNMILVCLSDKNIWALTCSSKDTDYGQWSDDFNNIVRSFKLNT